MQKNTIIISLCFLLAGFFIAYFIFGHKTNNTSISKTISNVISNDLATVANPFSVKDDNDQANDQNNVRIKYLESEVQTIKQQLKQIELVLQELPTIPGASSAASRPAANIRNRFSSALTQRLYSLDNLIRGGIDPGLAEDIVRRKNTIELKRLALQDRATRDGYLNTQQYFDELEEINSNDVSLREELGDERYDEYLYASKQNNRIKISSVMLGSAAEQAGIQKGDVVLSYDNNQLYNWQELKDATSEGQLGEYVSISIYRNGEIYSFSVPRGPLGIQLGATRLKP
jgi:membrane-associated protease RseP (regulator of RpoE activity)